MSTRISFSESCVPPKTSHHAKRIIRVKGHARLGDKPELTAAKSFWDALFLQHRPATPLVGPLLLWITLTWPWNTSDSKKTRANGWVYHDTAPDVDNMTKTLMDSMARCAYFNRDSQVACLQIDKYRGDNPGIEVTLGELSP